MKVRRAATTLALCLSILILSPGPQAWAEIHKISNNGAGWTGSGIQNAWTFGASGRPIAPLDPLSVSRAGMPGFAAAALPPQLPVSIPLQVSGQGPAIEQSSIAEDHEEETPESAKEALRILFRARQEVQEETRKTLNSELGGDTGDGILHRDILRIAHRLTEAAGLPPEAVQVFIGNSFIPNAFTQIHASERRYLENNASVAKTHRVFSLYLSLGLLRAAESEDQLAFYIAHEIAHNLKEHLKNVSAEAAAAKHFTLGHFHEFEADAEGLKLAAAAGYDPRAAIDGLFALDREYDRLRSQYVLLEGNKSDVVQAIDRLRDIHPHSNIRRAKMLEHLDEAMELYRPVPRVEPIRPVWMEHRNAAQRPSHLDRLEARLRDAQGAATVEEKIFAVESVIEKQKSKRHVDDPQMILIFEAYRQLLRTAASLEDLRRLEVSVRRELRDGALSKRFRSELAAKQIDLTLGKTHAGAMLEDWLHLSANMEPKTRSGGTLRLLGSIRSRRELDSAYKTLSQAAEILGLEMSSEEQRGDVAQRLWRATREVLSSELDRPALPEDIIDELLRKLSPPLLSGFRNELNTEIIESAFGPEASRSKRYRPSELALRLEHRGAASANRSRTPPVGSLMGWNVRHHKGFQVNTAAGSLAYRYERYYLEGLSAPSLEDQLDITFRFTLPKHPYESRPLIQILRQEGKLETYLVACYQKLASELASRLSGAANLTERRAAVDWYNQSSQFFLESSLFGLTDLKTIRETLEIVWSQVRELLKTEGPQDAFNDSDRSLLAQRFLTALSYAARASVFRTDLKGERPNAEEIRRTAALARDVESSLGIFSSRELVKAYARDLHAHLDHDGKYMKAYLKAIHYGAPEYSRFYKWVFFSRHDSKFTKCLAWLMKRLWRLAERLYAPILEKFQPRDNLPGVPREALRELTSMDFIHFLDLVGDPEVGASVKLMAVALLDNLEKGHNGLPEGSPDGPYRAKAAAATARWLLEDVAAAPVGPVELRALSRSLLRLNDLHPALLHPDFRVPGNTKNAFRDTAEFFKRNEVYRSMTKGEHPFRGVNVRWALRLAERFDETKTWPADFNDHMDLLDFLNSNGEFSGELDARILALARSAPLNFLKWVKRDEKRLQRFTATGLVRQRDFGTLEINGIKIPIPTARPLRVIRNPALRAALFDLLPESRLKETPPAKGLLERIRASWRLGKAYLAALHYFSPYFLTSLNGEGSLDKKEFELNEEADRVASRKTREAAARWDRSLSNPQERAFLAGIARITPENWPKLLPHQREYIAAKYKSTIKLAAVKAAVELYKVFAPWQEPLLEFLTREYPEPTRSRDELLERVIKARRLSPGRLSFLEAHKSYRFPNPLRVAEKQLLDQAALQMEKFAPAEKVDVFLHLAKVQRLTQEQQSRLNARLVNRERKKLAFKTLALRNIFQLESYLELLHKQDRALIVRAMFTGKGSLNSAPQEVKRLYRKLVIEGRDLPPLLEHIFDVYFDVLTEDERALFLSELATVEDVGGMDGPEIMVTALKGRGSLGAKFAQVLETYRGLLPKEYAAALAAADFKERAQDMAKMKAYELIQERLRPFGAARKTAPRRSLMSVLLKKLVERFPLLGLIVDAGLSDDTPPLLLSMKELNEISREALPPRGRMLTDADRALSLGDLARRRLVEQVAFLLHERGRRVQRLEYLGPELGSGSIKVVYKALMDDGRVWIIKLRAPGASYRLRRDFQIMDHVVVELRRRGRLGFPGTEQLIEEVKALLRAEMDFNAEAAIESAMIERGRNRPWYARLFAPTPYVPTPHPVYVGEDIMVEEYVPTIRFTDLPRWSLWGPDRRKIGKWSVNEGMFELIANGFLEPDPHKGNRHALADWFHRFWTRLVVLDVGQGRSQAIDPLKPLLKAGLALESGDATAAARQLIQIIRVPENRAEEQVLSAIASGLRPKPDAAFFERLSAVQKRLPADDEINLWVADFLTRRLIAAPMKDIDWVRARDLLKKALRGNGKPLPPPLNAAAATAVDQTVLSLIVEGKRHFPELSIRLREAEFPLSSAHGSLSGDLDAPARLRGFKHVLDELYQAAADKPEGLDAEARVYLRRASKALDAMEILALNLRRKGAPRRTSAPAVRDSPAPTPRTFADIFRSRYEDEELRTQVVPALKRWHGHPSSATRDLTRAVDILVRSKDPKAAEILEILLDPDGIDSLSAASRKFLLRALTFTGGIGHFLGEHLQRPARDPRSALIQKEMIALAAAENTEKSFQALFHFLKSPDESVRRRAAAAIDAALAVPPAQTGSIERLTNGLRNAEKIGALIKPEYAALRKAFLMHTEDYSEYLPKGALFSSLERAVLFRLLRDGAVSPWNLIELWIHRLTHGRAAVHARMEALIDGLRDAPPPSPPTPDASVE